MIIHGATMSPYVRKVLAFAAEKGIAVENKPVTPGPKSPEFMAISPAGKMPAMEDGDFSLCDSSAIIHYLEAKHPEPRLLPTEARALGKAIWFEEYADTIMTTGIGPIFFNRVVAKLIGLPGDPAAADKAAAENVTPILTYLESVIPASGYLVEDRLTLADLAVASPLVNLHHAGERIDAGTYPKTAAFYAAMIARPSFATIVATERKMINR